MDEWKQRGDDAARQFAFGALTRAGMDVYCKGSGDQTIDGVIRAQEGSKVRYWDVLVRSADTWKEIALPLDELAIDDSIVLAVNWATREILWVPGAALRHPDPDTPRDWLERFFSRPGVADLKKKGQLDLTLLRQLVTSPE